MISTIFFINESGAAAERLHISTNVTECVICFVPNRNHYGDYNGRNGSNHNSILHCRCSFFVPKKI
jgi:hypothetical protein